MFIYCIDEETRDKLLLKGFKFICDNAIGDKKCYVFEDNKLMTFSKEDKIFKTNKLYF